MTPNVVAETGTGATRVCGRPRVERLGLRGSALVLLVASYSAAGTQALLNTSTRAASICSAGSFLPPWGMMTSA